MIQHAFCACYARDLLAGLHQPQDVYKMALYTDDAILSAATTRYGPAGEASGDGYAAGGQALVGFTVTLKGDTSILDFADPVWPVASITARGALIYNASRGNRALVVLDFGADVTSTNGPFRVTLPPATAGAALIRVVSA